MDSDSGARTSASLLGKLRVEPLDQAAWERFVDRYGRRIYDWCLSRGMHHDDAQDVTQNVLLKLVDTMQSFEYDPSRSFRAWLKVVVRHAWQDFLRSRKQVGLGSGDSRILELLETVEAADSLVDRLRESFDLELLEQAK